MEHKIDWYSFTIPARIAYTELNDEIATFTRTTFSSLFKETSLRDRVFSGWEAEKAKGFYSDRLRHAESGMALSIGHTNPHIYVEISGKGCEFLRQNGALMDIICATKTRASRIDFAVDFPSEISPGEFSALRNDIRWRHLSTINSASGTTCYVGSRTGSRMARVYRYNEPHPRAHLLRVEAEYKGEAAKSAVDLLTTDNLLEVSLAAHAVFGWAHTLWTDGSKETVKIPYSSHSPDNAATVRWLYGVVASSLKKAVEDGLVDWKGFKGVLGFD